MVGGVVLPYHLNINCCILLWVHTWSHLGLVSLPDAPLPLSGLSPMWIGFHHRGLFPFSPIPVIIGYTIPQELITLLQPLPYSLHPPLTHSQLFYGIFPLTPLVLSITLASWERLITFSWEDPWWASSLPCLQNCELQRWAKTVYLFLNSGPVAIEIASKVRYSLRILFTYFVITRANVCCVLTLAKHRLF